MDYTNSGGAAAQSFAHQTSGPNTGFTHFATSIDPSLNATPTNSSQLHPHVASPSPYSNQSPNFNGSPGPQGYVPNDRSLPDRENVNAENLDEAYAQFIVYCNPYLAADISTTELKRIFKKPPMSDNKVFDLWKLYDLLGKLETGEIKTWIQLALDLGVEPPDLEKGQSTQKVQQYAVRLKRWMRALHVDGFFDFLRGKAHNYLHTIPPPEGPVPEVRDGVALEEDLAVRALDPTFRPKRGRRRVDGMDDGGNPTPPKRPQLDTSFAFNTPQHSHTAYAQSALALSAHPNDYNDPWAAASLSAANSQRGLEPHSAVAAPGSHQFRFNQDNPHTPHPLSAVSPMTDRPPDSAFPDDPSSAVTPSTKRQRRRHGPAVSSAWPSSNGSAGGKIRGRPPQNRSVRNGPFVTFPANPHAKEGPTVGLRRHSSGQTPVDQSVGQQLLEASQQGRQIHSAYQFPPTPASATQAGQMGGQMAAVHNRAGQRLSLQVPQHQGGPVHLVTPTVLVNGQSDSPQQQQGQQFLVAAKPAPKVSREDLKRFLAADLLRADLTNRKRLRGQEAKDLADAILNRLSSQNDGPLLVLSEKPDVEVQLVTLACWLGYATQLGLASGPVAGGQKKISVQKYRISGDGYESPIDDNEDEDGQTDGTPAAGEDGKIKEVFDVSWSLLLGGCGGDFKVQGLSIESAETEQEEETQGEQADDAEKEKKLEDRVKALEAELKNKDKEVQEWRQRVLEVVL
ncbi:ARS binding protein 2-domain-containing protein [Phyllosticta capitalensis]|uniref:ARS binding protein 2-domain-containing protein n=1 Tax=Phyllosticta capitalensis TaxID=121624 RepID=A0ABR1Z4V7_9PEZI